MILRCTICKFYFDAQWVDDEIQTICNDCWTQHFPTEAEIIPFRKPA